MRNKQGKIEKNKGNSDKVLAILDCIFEGNGALCPGYVAYDNA